MCPQSTLIIIIFPFVQSRYASRVGAVKFGWLQILDVSIITPGPGERLLTFHVNLLALFRWQTIQKCFT